MLTERPKVVKSNQFKVALWKDVKYGEICAVFSPGYNVEAITESFNRLPVGRQISDLGWTKKDSSVHNEPECVVILSDPTPESLPEWGEFGY